ncbi:hypothetical protein [Nostoc sp. C110]|uniref:hypothetical protein n=1 Tax=Nostoc sp. C110 TaxID=3349876 RepID=UPI00370DC6B2
MAMRYLTAGADMPSLDNQRKMEQYCNKIISVLNSQQEYLQIFEKGTEIIEEQFLYLNINIDNRDVITTVSFVEQLKKRLESEFSKINFK